MKRGKKRIERNVPRELVVSTSQYEPLEHPEVFVGGLRPTKQVFLDDLLTYFHWKDVDQNPISRRIFEELYIVPQAGVAPSRRRRDMLRLFQKSLQRMFYDIHQMQNARELAQAS